MPNLATTLKEEIRRLAKKEIKAQTDSTKQAVAQYRRDIAKLKRSLQAQQKEINSLKTQQRKSIVKPQADEEAVESARFSSKSVRSQRNRLGLSAPDYAKLVGVSPLTIYNWEKGKNRPQAAQLAALVAVRGIGKREAIQRLEAISEEES